MKPTIYLLDDDPLILDLHKEVVEMDEVNIQCFTHTSHFFKQASTFSPSSILVLDYA